MKLIFLASALLLSIVTSQTASAQSGSATPATTCLILLSSSCKGLPVNQWFPDTADTANRDAVRCDQRSKEYSQYCNFFDAKYTYAVFQASGVNASIAVTLSPPSASTTAPVYSTYFLDAVTGALLGQLK